MELKRLAQYTRLCRKLGISKLTLGDVSIEVNLAFESERKRQPMVVNQAEDQTKELPPLTDEELLFWSSSNPV